MGQIMAIDYGKARTGLAVTDDMQIIASALQTVETPKLIEFLKTYFQLNKVEEIVVGLPTDLRGNLSEIETEIQQFLEQFKTEFPQIKINRFDERFTSKMASFFISQSGKSKKERQQKGLIDKVSATLILQNFLETR
ncbi:Holliday junction DNA helicase RuvA [Elizabethkingia meningoseptica]|uniref:Putative pre-16S rRNA nuclease n=1 Tax=Elizabethkingia meningoseptica TaxID=238 RepID=A0A1V3U522_ELIME|nr:MULTISPECIES: Holliday junction resolvase RuvX [Elizabethkingia]AQX03731.1 Holliday junction DNA helicase RuvA [Elizabethkingia meningoseptica]AQX11178.1 Holliday junction DNA helicase RuvA [Elizabethkingia meningoseptica]AQX45770.1 crossover junction endodeoxyribonuclease RuvA [Elizabethkingia meningoseptica]EOR29818.1 Holliday junction resolvase [Elizabethkingia meningoseptica ATCC 13253 = NBRC 12535]KUY15063.1 Holliday junction resolvase [Elizabethkingia meningoseptica]